MNIALLTSLHFCFSPHPPLVLEVVCTSTHHLRGRPPHPSPHRSGLGVRVALRLFFLFFSVLWSSCFESFCRSHAAHSGRCSSLRCTHECFASVAGPEPALEAPAAACPPASARHRSGRALPFEREDSRPVPLDSALSILASLTRYLHYSHAFISIHNLGIAHIWLSVFSIEQIRKVFFECITWQFNSIPELWPKWKLLPVLGY